MIKRLSLTYSPASNSTSGGVSLKPSLSPVHSWIEPLISQIRSYVMFLMRIRGRIGNQHEDYKPEDFFDYAHLFSSSLFFVYRARTQIPSLALPPVRKEVTGWELCGSPNYHLPYHLVGMLHCGPSLAKICGVNSEGGF